MKELSYSIADEVFKRFPGYVRGVVIGHGASNGASPSELVQLLRDAEGSVRSRLKAATIAEEHRHLII